jgi:hypothetical protein
MKKLFVVLVAIVLVASFASAQNIWGQGKMSAGVGAELALPMGSAGDHMGMGIGGFALGQYGINEDVLGTLQIGYTAFGEKTWATGVAGHDAKESVGSFNILVGGKYNLSKAVTPGLYGTVQLGEYICSVKSTYPQATATVITTPPYYTYSISDVSSTTSSSEFVIVIGAGYQIGDNIDATVKYVINSAVGNLALNVAYIIPL